MIDDETQEIVEMWNSMGPHMNYQGTELICPAVVWTFVVGTLLGALCVAGVRRLRNG